jgi:hypothetical protein
MPCLACVCFLVIRFSFGTIVKMLFATSSFGLPPASARPSLPALRAQLRSQFCCVGLFIAPLQHGGLRRRRSSSGLVALPSLCGACFFATCDHYTWVLVVARSCADFSQPWSLPCRPHGLWERCHSLAAGCAAQPPVRLCAVPHHLRGFFSDHIFEARVGGGRSDDRCGQQYNCVVPFAAFNRWPAAPLFQQHSTLHRPRLVPPAGPDRRWRAYRRQLGIHVELRGSHQLALSVHKRQSLYRRD